VPLPLDDDFGSCAKPFHPVGYGTLNQILKLLIFATIPAASLIGTLIDQLFSSAWSCGDLGHHKQSAHPATPTTANESAIKVTECVGPIEYERHASFQSGWHQCQ
jgi:hypothetical protein